MFCGQRLRVAEGELVGGGHVPDVDEVARLLAVAVDGQRLSALHAADEYRDDARLAVRGLARAVDVGPGARPSA